MRKNHHCFVPITIYNTVKSMFKRLIILKIQDILLTNHGASLSPASLHDIHLKRRYYSSWRSQNYNNFFVIKYAECNAIHNPEKLTT
jgi:hypothetical protein